MCLMVRLMKNAAVPRDGNRGKVQILIELINPLLLHSHRQHTGTHLHPTTVRWHLPQLLSHLGKPWVWGVMGELRLESQKAQEFGVGLAETSYFWILLLT